MPRNDAPPSGLLSWLRRWWRALAAELLSTALLVLLGLAAVVPVRGEPVPLTHPAFSFGLVIIINAQVFGPVSGAHMNPAVTLAAVLCRQLDVIVGLAYFVAQTVGALLGFGALVCLSSAEAMRGGVGCTTPAPLVAPAAAAGVEALLTGTLVLLCCAGWAAPPDPTAPLKVGLGVAGLIYAGGAMTGASLNPVRSLAPAIFQNVWRDHWVYWVGPLGGAALAAALHRYVLRPRAPAPAPAAEELPLHDKPAPAP